MFVIEYHEPEIYELTNVGNLHGIKFPVFLKLC